MLRVQYTCPAFDCSGYAEAARNHIAALHTAGVGVDVRPVSFEKYKSDLGNLGILVQSLVKPTSTARIQIIHLTPENYSRTLDPTKYNIGYTVWETSKLPDGWKERINQLDEVWVPCEHNIKVFKNSGITIPIYCMPHPFNIGYANEVEKAEASITNTDPNDYVFYSIYQWTERKNPTGLLKAYLTEFTSQDPVALVIKTYLVNPGSVTETQNIKKAIADVKAKLHIKDFPKILLITSLLSRSQIQSLHHESDCYISLHRCEGYGIPIVEAMLSGNPVIATRYGGPEDFINGKDREGTTTGFEVSYQETPVYGMPWNNYTGHQEWAEPNLMDAKKAMRYCFENREQAKSIGKSSQEWVKQELNWEVIGNRMKDRLEEISKGLI